MTEAERSFLALAAIGVFTVDENGYVWRHRRLIAGSRTGAPPYWQPVEPRRRADVSISDGYPTVMFSDGNKRHKIFVHRLVWMLHNQADIPAPMEVNHRDGVRANNEPSNLELMTPSGNVLHGIHVLGRKPVDQRGRKNPQARLTESQVLEIRRLCKAKVMAQSKVGEMFGISQRSVSEIYLRKTWKHLG